MRTNGALLALLLAVAVPAFGANSRESTAHKALAGSGGKSWVHVAMKVFLGGDKRCTQGEVWLFRPDGKLQIDRCVDGKLQSTPTIWRVFTIDALDVGVKIDDRDYVLLMPELGNGKKAGTMTLRRRSDGKADPSEDLEFMYEKGMMAEDRYPRATLALKMLTPIIAVIGILIGVWKFQADERHTRERDREQIQRSDELAYRRALWKKRRDAYSAIGDTVGQLAANVDDRKAFDEAVKKFDALYWGGMVLVEDAPVATAMKRLHEEILDLRADRSSAERIKQRAYAVGEACRESLR